LPKFTPSGKPTKLGHFESQVKGTMPDHEMYAIANKVGLMHGNKATPKGTRASSTAGKKGPMARGFGK
jgi:hypothetical protein